MGDELTTTISPEKAMGPRKETLCYLLRVHLSYFLNFGLQYCLTRQVHQNLKEKDNRAFKK